MLIYKIFLASSSELAADRVAFGDMVQEYNDRSVTQQKQVHFALYKWEGDTISFADKRKQSTYNDNIETCHLFVLLYETKVGMYTEEEYGFAYNRLKQIKSPQVIVFRKATTKPVDATVPLFEAKIGLGGDGQFRSGYTDAASLKVQFFDELQKLFAMGVLKYGATDIHNEGQSVPANFIGRDDELKAIKKKLEKGGKLMLINAEGGIGKTTLAAKYWQESLADYDHRAWLFCENGIISELKKLAPPLKIDLSNMTEDEQLANLKAGLQQVSHRFLLVLDNANTPEDIEAFKQNFRGFQWHVLITSRCKGMAEHSTEYEEYAINTLPRQQAKELFISNYKEDTPEFDALLDRLLIGINYHTLLVDIFSKNLKKASELGMNFSTFLEKLEATGLYLKDDSFEIHSKWSEHNQHKEWNTTNAILDALYDFTQLATNEVERYTLVNIALLPAVPYALLFLADVFNLADKRIFYDTLKHLTRKGWLSFDEKEYRISPVVQQLTLEKNKATLQDDGQKLIDSLNKKLENNGGHLKHFNEAKPFVALTATIVKHLIEQPYDGLSLLTFNAAIYFLSIGNLTEASDCIQNDIKINEILGDKNGLAISFSKLGDVYEKLGQLGKALEYYRERNRIGEELHRDYPSNVSYKNGLAVSFERLGKVHEKLGQLGKALEYHRKRNMISEELHEDYPTNVSFKNGLAISYQNLGIIKEKIGSLNDALNNYYKYKNLMEILHKSFPTDVSFKDSLTISFCKLGEVYQTMGQLGKALIYYGEYNKLKEELHRDFPSDVSFKNGLNVSFEKLGGVYEQIGQLEKALVYYCESNKLIEELHKDYPSHVSFKNGLAISFQKLGVMHEKLGKMDKALEYYREDIKLSEELHRDYPSDVAFKNGLAISFERLGKGHEKLGELSKALEYYREDIKLSEELHRDYPSDMSFTNGLAVSYTYLAGLYVKKNNIPAAKMNCQAAASIWKDMATAYPQYAEFSNNLEWVENVLKELD